MDKREFLENNIEDDGKRAYELDGMRAVFPSSWTDEQRQEWFQKAKVDLHLRRNLRMIKKNGSQSLLRSYRNHGARHGEE